MPQAPPGITVARPIVSLCCLEVLLGLKYHEQN
jgi:hypothetical protein